MRRMFTVSGAQFLAEMNGKDLFECREVDIEQKRERGLCGAKCRTGEPCTMRVVIGKRRCRLHGGLSTGARTSDGRARLAESNRRRAEKRRLEIERGRVVLAELDRRIVAGEPLI